MAQQRAPEHRTERQQRQRQGATGQGREHTSAEQHQQMVKAGQRVQQAILQRVAVMAGVSKGRNSHQQQGQGEGLFHGDTPYQDQC
ncbi:hypothetical protein D3C72_1749550 [compost metagenome]